jgi:hypothetical protein
MSCCNCCVNTLNLGCLNSCGAILNTGIVADPLTAGTWILELTFGSTSIYFSVDVLDTETVIFTMPNLNESYTYQGVIIAPDGEIVSISQGGIDYDCIEFSTKTGLNNNTINI